MISIANRPKLKSYASFSNTLSLGGFATLLVSVVLPYLRPEYAQISLGLMLGGLILSTIGIYLANRWVRKPRPEISLDNALKKFPDSYRLYHYSGLPCKHILLSPYGLVLFRTINWEGKFTYANGRWREFINFGRAIRYPLENHLGDPTKSARNVEQSIRDFIKDLPGEDGDLPIQSMIVFLHFKVILEVEHPPMPVCMIDALKKKIPAKGERLPETLYDQIKTTLDNRFPPNMELRV
jgi:hypothetical protein